MSTTRIFEFIEGTYKLTDDPSNIKTVLQNCFIEWRTEKDIIFGYYDLSNVAQIACKVRHLEFYGSCIKYQQEQCIPAMYQLIWFLLPDKEKQTLTPYILQGKMEQSHRPNRNIIAYSHHIPLVVREKSIQQSLFVV